MSFNPHTLPLSGRHLIEASAGTGKTYNIANVFLRLLLEPHPSRADNQPLRVNEILVVTFTNAATDELRGRIRSKIEDALNHFRFGGSRDAFICAYQPADPALACQRLHETLLLVDEAAIFTIHAFATRLIQAFLFETGALAGVEVVISGSPRRQQALDDLWRELQLLAASDASLREVVATLDRSQLNTLAYSALRGEIHPPLQKTDAPREGMPLSQRLSAYVTRHLQELDARLLQARSPLQARWQSLRDDGEAIDAVLKQPQASVTYKSYSRKKFVDEIDKWLSSAERSLKAPKDDASGGWGTRFHHVDDHSAAAGTAFHTFFRELQQHLAECAGLGDVETRLLRAFIAHELARRMAEYDPACLQPDDVIRLINDKLADANAAPALQRRVTQQYPVCMVDEFQDTDPDQFRMFDQLYRDEERLGFYAIGDPKQSIYGFRGADIFAYLDVKARNRPDNIHSLDTNYRSTDGVMQGINALFKESVTENKPPVFFYEGIRYDSVTANKKTAVYRRGTSTEVPSLVFVGNKRDHDTFNNLLPIYADDCAERIVQLLQGENAARIDDAPLQPGHIAVLVKNYIEADAIKAALRRRQLQAVYLAQKDSVFQRCLFASDLLFVLRAMDDPASKRALKAAFATPLLRGYGSDCRALDALDNDDAFYDAAVERFSACQQLWNRRGILPALEHFLSDPFFAPSEEANSSGGLASLLARRDDRDRLMTDFRHLGDLLQQQALQYGSRELLMDWYAQQLQDDGDTDEDSKSLRLESDDNLVRIVTLHGCKGLEYPVVFVPFFFGFKDIDLKKDVPLFHKKESHKRESLSRWQAVIDYRESPLAVSQAMEEERRAEDMRLLYVGLTRAIYQCYIGISRSCNRSASNPNFPKTPWARLLGIDDPAPDWDTLATALQARLTFPSGGTAPYAFEEVLNTCTRFQPGAATPATTLRAPEAPVYPRSAWTITSYSSLAHQKEAPLFESQRQDDDAGPSEAATLAEYADNIRYQLRGGKHAGDFFHKVFERLALGETDSQRILEEEALQQNLPPQGIHDWLQQMLQLRLPVANATLPQLFAGAALPEWRFDFALGSSGGAVSTPTLEHINEVLMHTCGTAAGIARRDGQAELQGIMNGSIDLLFIHNQKAYVLDYKSNTLGPSPHFYQQANMDEAMRTNRYDLQYLIYSVAVHRYLQQRLGARYAFDGGEYEFGGVFYLFLRGMGLAEYPERGIWFHRPTQAVIEALDHAFSGACKKVTVDD